TGVMACSGCVGGSSRGMPALVVSVLFGGGEHGKFAARIAAQVIKAYVDKQRRQPTKVATGDGKVEVGAVWNASEGASEVLRGGHFVLPASRKRVPLAVAAPGLE